MVVIDSTSPDDPSLTATPPPFYQTSAYLTQNPSVSPLKCAQSPLHLLQKELSRLQSLEQVWFNDLSWLWEETRSEGEGVHAWLGRLRTGSEVVGSFAENFEQEWEDEDAFEEGNEEVDFAEESQEAECTVNSFDDSTLE
ncbi:hypothetical protein BT69DRAFT_161439 [Atractiella rhizophila]|nr:hypothetical protein BT69DRAFT_161439 [Atractiella rhizophila]